VIVWHLNGLLVELLHIFHDSQCCLTLGELWKTWEPCCHASDFAMHAVAKSP